MSYNIPLFDLNYGTEEENAILQTIRSKWISMGPKCLELEALFAKMLHVRYAVSVTNCTAALHLACAALGLRENDEVICPSLTFSATANSIKYTGAKPVFCDIKDVQHLTLNPAVVTKAITPKTKAIMVMHYAGFPCDMDAIMKIAKEHSLYVIEDACHGPLSEYKGKKLGTIGDVGCFSFFSNKNISTGEGGMVVTNRDDLYEKIKLLRSHGMSTMSYERAQGHATEYDIKELGYNYRLDDIRASLAVAQLHKLEADLKKRSSIRSLYCQNLKAINGVCVPFEDNTEFVSNYIMPVVLKNSCKEKRDFIRTYLHGQGIQTSIHYPAVHRFSIYQDASFNLPVTDYVTDNELTLPMYAALNSEEVLYICDKLKEALNAYEQSDIGRRISGNH